MSSSATKASSSSSSSVAGSSGPSNKKNNSAPPPPPPLPPPLVFGNAESVLRHVRSYTQSLFQEEQRLVFEGLSNSYKDQWGKPFGHDDRLVVVKSPYDVPMGSERSMWMNKFTQLQKMGRLDLMPHLIYDVHDESFELVSPVDLVSPDPFLKKKSKNDSDLTIESTKRPVEAYDLLSLEASAINRELVPEPNEESSPPPPPADPQQQQHDDASSLLLPPVGTRLRVFWPDDKAWYDGTIDENSGAISHVTYDDGDEHWIRLADEKYKVLPGNNNSNKDKDNSATGAASAAATSSATKKKAKTKPTAPPAKAKTPSKASRDRHELSDSSDDTDDGDTPIAQFVAASSKRKATATKSTATTKDAQTKKPLKASSRDHRHDLLDESDDTEDDTATAQSFTTPPRKRKRAGDDELFSPGGDSAYTETDDVDTTDVDTTAMSPPTMRLRQQHPSDPSYRRPAKEPKQLRNGKYVATDPKPDGYEWCDTLGLWKQQPPHPKCDTMSDKDSLSTAHEVDEEVEAEDEVTSTEAEDDMSSDDMVTDESETAHKRDDVDGNQKTPAVVVDRCVNRFAHALLEEKSNWKMRMAYAKLGTIMALNDACPPVESDATAKVGAPASSPVKSNDDVVKREDDAVKCEDSVSSEDEVKIVSVKQGVPPPRAIEAAARPRPRPSTIASKGLESCESPMRRVSRVKQALEWEIAFDDNDIDGPTLNRLRELLETLESVHVSVELLHETNINVSLLRLKSELASRKSAATVPLLKLIKHILATWKETYGLRKQMKKELQPIIHKWQEAIKSNHTNGIDAELQHLVRLIKSRGLCRHFVQELGLASLMDETRQVYARHKKRPHAEFENLHLRILNAPDE